MLYEKPSKKPSEIRCVIPARLQVGESFAIKIKLLGSPYCIERGSLWNKAIPNLNSPFNVNTGRDFEYFDDGVPAWQGRLVLDGGGALDGDGELLFDGEDQGAFSGDNRAIRIFSGFRWTRPGMHFIRLRDPQSGVTAWSNPVYVSETKPEQRLYFGDPHWQTFFSDGLRGPEELYAYARDESFLDFGALSDHVELLTDRQWDYQVAVTNDYNEPHRFATLVGMEWTHHWPEQKPGHRNIYYRGNAGPVLRATDPKTNTLDKLWSALDGIEAIAIPHHPANVVMGCRWELGWNPKYEKAVEIYSVWGSSERSRENGNIQFIQHCKGEADGRHVLDALRMGYRFGFVGGGDVHDGRPGDTLRILGRRKDSKGLYGKGLCGVWAPELTREAVYDAMKSRNTYAASTSRIYLETRMENEQTLFLRAASEDGLKEIHLVRRDGESVLPIKDSAPRVMEDEISIAPLNAGDFCYLRVRTERDKFAWSSPFYGTEDD